MILEPISNISNQVKSLQPLKGDTQHPGHVHTIELLDNFTHVGPNGIHQCLVCEVLGPSIERRFNAYENSKLPGRVAKEICKQIVQGVSYMHSKGVVHGSE